MDFPLKSLNTPCWVTFELWNNFQEQIKTGPHCTLSFSHHTNFQRRLTCWLFSERTDYTTDDMHHSLPKTHSQRFDIVSLAVTAILYWGTNQSFQMINGPYSHSLQKNESTSKKRVCLHKITRWTCSFMHCIAINLTQRRGLYKVLKSNSKQTCGCHQQLQSNICLTSMLALRLTAHSPPMGHSHSHQSYIVLEERQKKIKVPRMLPSSWRLDTLFEKSWNIKSTLGKSRLPSAKSFWAVGSRMFIRICSQARGLAQGCCRSKFSLWTGKLWKLHNVSYEKHPKRLLMGSLHCSYQDQYLWRLGKWLPKLPYCDLSLLPCL